MDGPVGLGATMPSFGLLAALTKLAGVGIRGRFTPTPSIVGRGPAAPGTAPAGTMAAATAAPHALVLSHLAMYCSSAAVVSVPAAALKLSRTKRRFAGCNLNSAIFVRVGSSFHFVTKRAIMRSSETGAPAAVVAAGRATPAAVATNGLIPPGTAPGGLTKPCAAAGVTMGTCCTGRAGISTSSRGIGSGAPASWRCALMRCKSIFRTSSRHMPPL